VDFLFGTGERELIGVVMTSNRYIGWLLLCNLLFFIAMAAEFAVGGARYMSRPRVSLIQARAIALGTYPGHIDSEELEKEPGGSGLRYSFVINCKNIRREVGVDAETGKVLENSSEGSSERSNVD